MSRIEEMVQELKAKRDELEVKIHLASKEAQQEFRELEDRWEHLRGEAGLDRTAEGVGAALELVGEELKRGYERIRRAL